MEIILILLRLRIISYFFLAAFFVRCWCILIWTLIACSAFPSFEFFSLVSNFILFWRLKMTIVCLCSFGFFCISVWLLIHFSSFCIIVSRCVSTTLSILFGSQSFRLCFGFDFYISFLIIRHLNLKFYLLFSIRFAQINFIFSTFYFHFSSFIIVSTDLIFIF